MLPVLALALASLAPRPALPEPLPEIVALESALRGAPPAAVPSPEPQDARAALALSAVFWRASRFDAAAAALGHVSPDPVLGPFVQLVRAEALFYDRRPEEAARLFEAVATAGASAATGFARRRWAEAELAAAHPAKACDLLHACLIAANGQGVAELWEELGRAASQAGNVADAREAFRNAWLQDPDSPAGREAQEELLALDGGKVRPQASAASRMLRRAQQLLKTGHPEAAHSDLAEAEAAATPGSPEAARDELFLAQADRALGNEPEAFAHWQRASKATDPLVAATAKISLAKLTEARGDWKGAVRLLNEVWVARAAKSEGAEALYLKAWILLQHGRVDEALAGFATLASHPGKKHADEARWWRGWALYTQQHYEAAAGEWDRLAEKSRASFGAQGLYWEARALRKAGRTEKADSALARLRASARDSYYAVLATGAASVPQPVGADCAGTPPPGAFLIELQRAALLWALGYPRYAAAELDLAAKLARGPRELWAVAQADATFDHPGSAFALLASGRARCSDTVERSRTLLFPRPFRDAVERSAAAAGIDPLLIWSIMRQESRFRDDARSAAQAGGAMQLLGATKQRIASISGVTVTDGSQVGTGIGIAAWYLRALSERFGGNPALIAAAYNAGPEAVTSWLKAGGGHPLDEFVEAIPFRETRRYVKSVLENYAGYRSIFGAEGPPFEPFRAPGVEAPAGVSF